MKYTCFALQYCGDFVHFRSGGAVDLTSDPNPRSLFKTKANAAKKQTNGILYYESGRIVPAGNLSIVEVTLEWK